MASEKNKIALPGDPLFFQNPNAEKLIVFIHGFTGDVTGTWSSDGDSPFFWPEHLAKDSAFQNADVLSFGYASECGPTFNIREIAQSLELALNQLLEMKPYQSLSFIAHSLGGLVVREFILSRHKHLITAVSVTSVITLGTPNLGSGLAKFASYFCGNIQMDDLKPGREGFLDSLNERWRERFLQPESEQSFRFSAGYEIAPVNILVGRIVEKDSAVYFAQQTQGFLKDHSRIAKPYGKNDPLYLWVRQQLLKKAPDPRVPLYDDAEVQRLETIIDQMQKDLKGTDLEEALNLIVQGKLDEALTLLSENEDKEDEQILKTAKTRFAKAQVYELKLDYKNALKYYETVARLAPENSLYQNEAGFMANTLGQYDKAIAYFEQALTSDLNTFGQDHPSVAIRWNNLGEAWRAKGDYDKAIGYYQKALASDLKTFGPGHPQVTIYWNNLGMEWASRRNYGKAIEYYEKALASDLKNFGPNHPDVVRDWNNLGVAWEAKGNYDKAIKYYEKALVVIKKMGLPHRVGLLEKNLAVARRKKGGP